MILFFLIFFFSSFLPTTLAQFPPQIGSITIDYSENKWELKMLNKLRFDKSENFYRTKTFIMTDKSEIYYGEYFTGSSMPNLNIKYYIDPMDGSPQCNYSIEMGRNAGLISSKSKDGRKSTSTEDEIKEKCQKEGKPVCVDPRDSSGLVQMQGAGVFNEPMADPKCLYEFYQVATERSEYELLRYCAKGYFYQGFNYDDREEWKEMREDWVLYLMNGMLKCNVSTGKNPSETNQELVGKGFKLSMVQRNKQELGKACGMEATLCEYEDRDKEGKFMMAAIIGSAKLKEPGKDSWSDLNGQCMKKYKENLMQDGKYSFKLKVGHYCTCGKEYEELEFELDFDPKDLADPGIEEDKNVIIYLDLGILRFSTDHLLCASKYNCDKTKLAEIRKRLGINKPGEMEEDSPTFGTRSNLDEFLIEDEKMNALNESAILNGTMGGGNETFEGEEGGQFWMDGENGTQIGDKNDKILTILNANNGTKN